MAVDAGLRRGEISVLTVRDVDIARRTILVRRSKNGKPREVGMTLRVQEALGRHLAAHPKGVEELFLTFDGLPLRKYSLTSAMGEAVKRVGLEGFRLHDLRHMHGVRLAERGVPPAVIKAALGHSTLFSTLRYAIIRIIRKVGLDPAAFAWSVVQEGSGSIPAAQLTYTGTKYFCSIRHAIGMHYMVQFQPDAMEPMGFFPNLEGQQMLRATERWLVCLRREVDAPDLWAEVAKMKEFGKTVRGKGPDRKFHAQPSSNHHARG